MVQKSNFIFAALVFAAGSICAETIVTTKGDRFKNTRVTNVTPATITIVHRVGVATIPLSEVSAEIQRRYHYDPAKAQNWLRELAEQQRQQALAAEKKKKEAATAAYWADLDRRQKQVEVQAEVEKMHSLAHAVYDPATRRWYRSPEEANAAREQALKDALEAKRAA